MRLTAGCWLRVEAAQLTPVILMLRPRSGAAQWVWREEYVLTPQVPVLEYSDGYGNLCQRLVVPPGLFTVQTTVAVQTAAGVDCDLAAGFVPVQQLPEAVLQFLLPSRYCPCDLMGAQAAAVVAGAPLGYGQVQAIQDWIHQNIKYCYGTSTASTSAVETLERRVGVCRDFAHLGMALCRALSIPARMVVGYLYGLEPMDLHAWFEAFVGDRWYTFDATQPQLRGNRVAIAYGRDAADVALMTQFGALDLLQMRVWVRPGEALS